MFEIILITAWALITCALVYKCVELTKYCDDVRDDYNWMTESMDNWVETCKEANTNYSNAYNEIAKLKQELKQTKQSQEIKIVEYSSNQYSINRGDYVYSMQGEWITLEEAKKWNYNHCLYDSFDQVKAIAKAMKDDFIIVNTFTV